MTSAMGRGLCTSRVSSIAVARGPRDGLIRFAPMGDSAHKRTLRDLSGARAEHRPPDDELSLKSRARGNRNRAAWPRTAPDTLGRRKSVGADPPALRGRASSEPSCFWKGHDNDPDRGELSSATAAAL